MKTVYTCEHCKKQFKDKNLCKFHENACNENPNIVQLCVTIPVEIQTKPFSEHCGPCRFEIEDVCILFCKNLSTNDVSEAFRCKDCISSKVRKKSRGYNEKD